MTLSRWTTMAALLLLGALLLASCGGGSAGKTLARRAVAAMEAEDQTRLDEVLAGFDNLNPIEKARFATEIARQGEAVRKILTEQLGQAAGN